MFAGINMSALVAIVLQFHVDKGGRSWYLKSNCIYSKFIKYPFFISICKRNYEDFIWPNPILFCRILQFRKGKSTFPGKYRINTN